MHEQKTITYEELMKEREEQRQAFKALPLNEKLPKTVEKMIYIVRGRTGGSEIYANMLLSMKPNSGHSVCMEHWLYKSDEDDFQTMLELMQEYNSYKWEYEKLILPYVEELKDFLSK